MSHSPIRIKRLGSDTLGAGGTKTVNDATVTELSKIFVIPVASVVNAGFLTVTATAAGSFTVRSSNILDARAFSYIIFE